ncbi:MAG: formylglycine-generating enzyme family protein [Lysobacter sp.]|nr:formylglycine-generating enzyme family protein [Lysobacter sp.]
MHAIRYVVCVLLIAPMLALTACGRDDVAGPKGAPSGAATRDARDPASVTISGDDRAADALTWSAPVVELQPEGIAAAKRGAAKALREERLYADAQSAIPLYLAILELAADDTDAGTGLDRALAALLVAGDEALLQSEEDPFALTRAHEIAAVARTVRATDADVIAFLSRVDQADRIVLLNDAGERDVASGTLGESGASSGSGALGKFREVLRLRPDQPRALQGVASVESALIRRAEVAAEQRDFDDAARWLQTAAKVRRGTGTVADAGNRIEAIRLMQIRQLHDEGLAALGERGGLELARRNLAEILRIAPTGNAAASDLRQRIDLASHYGLFRPGQVFTDALKSATRGPEMVVVPHGGFRMGAKDTEADAGKAEKPQHYVRFDRGFAMSRTEVTVGQFRRFMAATQHRARAQRRGFSTVYDERSGNFVRRSGVDWRSDYAGNPAADELPVLHIDARDAEAYAHWLSQQTGQRYRLPHEAEFEYALRAGKEGRFPWGEGLPRTRAGNFTGAGDRSPSGREWSNAFTPYRDGYWGPAPVGRFSVNAYDLHDLAGNVSEWTGDCWHVGYRRAPANGGAWVNPGCRTRVIRGGSWASSPEQTRAAWRMSAGHDVTNARTGFRVVREI